MIDGIMMHTDTEMHADESTAKVNDELLRTPWESTRSAAATLKLHTRRAMLNTTE